MESNKPYKLASREYKKEDTVVEITNSRGQIVRVGGPRIVTIAGPCAVESREQMMEIAAAVASSGAVMLRGGAYKPRTSPYSFQGLGEEGLKYLREASDKYGLPIVTEIVDTSLVDVMEKYGVDVYQIGARNMQNFELLKKVGALGKPVILKRGLAATIDDLLMSAEYLLSSGTEKVILCERGIRTFERATRNTLDLSAVPVLRSLTHLPIIVDPSHAVGIRSMIPQMGLAAIASGADGIIVEVHNHPEKAMSDGPQALLPEQFDKLMHDVEAFAPVLGKAVAHIRDDEAAHDSHAVVKTKKSEEPHEVICSFSGKRGAYAEQAINRYFDGDNVKAQAENSFADIFQAVTDGKSDFGMVPIENSLAGTIYENYDNFTRFADVEIIGSITLNVRHALLGVKGATLADVKKVYSHPQALSQCKKFLDSHADWEKIDAVSTATAANNVRDWNSKENAAIASENNAALYGLEVLQEDIENNPGNFTRFMVIAAKDKHPAIKIQSSKPSNATFIFKTKNEHGALYRSLGVFDSHKLNLTRLESRPIGGEPWKYWFFAVADIKGKKDVEEVLADLRDATEEVRVLGIY